MNKFKKGQLVEFKEWEDMEEEFGITAEGSINCQCKFSEKMRPLCSLQCEIAEVFFNGRIKIKSIEYERELSVIIENYDTNDTFAFSSDMVKPSKKKLKNKK